MKRVLLVLVATSLAVAGPPFAGATTTHPATSHAAATHTKTTHALKLRISIIGLSPEGRPPLAGAQKYLGWVDGTIAGKSQQGAVRGVNLFNVTDFQGTNITFGANGSTYSNLIGSASLSPDGTETFSGNGLITGGNGIYHGATGTFTFTGALPKGSNVSTFTVTGTLKY
jgi:hypothetical protein